MPELYGIIKISGRIGLFLGDCRVLLPDFWLNTAGKQRRAIMHTTNKFGRLTGDLSTRALYGTRMKKTCYMCEREATSKEHVPPKCLFPEKKDLPQGVDFRKNLIKVPSCDEHNSQKSMDDEYFLFLLLSAAQGNESKQNHFDTKLVRAVKRKPHIYKSFLKDMKEVIIRTGDGKCEQAAGFRVDAPRLENIVRHMASGIFFHHYKKKWNGAFRMLTNSMFDMTSSNASEVNKTINEVVTKISWAFGSEVAHGENGNIFSYKMYSEEGDRHAIFMSFFEGFEITVLLQGNV